MRRSELVAGEWYAAKHPSFGPDHKPIRVQVLDTRGVYESDGGVLVFSDSGQNVWVQPTNGSDFIMRLQLIRQTWADYEAGIEVPKWEYQPKDTAAAYKQALGRVLHHPLNENAALQHQVRLEMDLLGWSADAE